ncbi:MAG: hypothetical protein H7329_20210 [Opitutaceae bacterium]|nr:hypothetical protein [Cytophagales bacterium]
MKKTLKYCGSLLIAFTILTSCGIKKAEDPKEILAGTSSKVWHIAKQTDANGDKDKLTEKEKEEKLNLYADGKFSIVDDKGTATGSWTVEGTQKLVLQFADQPVTENFSITEMNKDKVVLKAGDGSEMVLKAD